MLQARRHARRVRRARSAATQVLLPARAALLGRSEPCQEPTAPRHASPAVRAMSPLQVNLFVAPAWSECSLAVQGSASARSAHLGLTATSLVIPRFTKRTSFLGVAEPFQCWFRSGASSCHKCTPGTFVGSPGELQCSSCPLGTYGTRSGQSTCIACSAGMFGTISGNVISRRKLALPTDLHAMLRSAHES
mmetsp:Transcript_26561/g.69823  ORF Transcript_26561/g.69823 Transcript_26561/m.69823 type:complete len:191 (+) Transcript_26561:30-602(+)